MTSSPETAQREGAAPAQPLSVRIVRLLVELAALAGLAGWGWHVGASTLTRATLAIVLPIIAGGLLTVFATPRDPARHSEPRMAIPGTLRLVLELVLLGFAACAIWLSVSRAASETFLTVAGVLYVVTWDRQLWLLRH